MEFEHVFRAEYPRLVGALYLLTGSRFDAEDVAQEALARVYEPWERVRSLESPIGYAYRVAMNVYRRRRWRATRLPRADPPVPSSDPAEGAVKRRDVRRAHLRLPVGLREALVLQEWLGLTSEELGARLGIRPGSARARLHRARRAFERAIGESYE